MVPRRIVWILNKANKQISLSTMPALNVKNFILIQHKFIVTVWEPEILSVDGSMSNPKNFAGPFCYSS